MSRETYYIKEDNSAVQDFYADIIGKALEKNGCEPYKAIELEKAYTLPKDSIIICISHYIVCKLALRGYKNLLYWVQGTSPDESYMRNHSRLRWFLISVIEWYALKKAKYVFMVSKGMLSHYRRKYHTEYSNKTYIMPCYNSEIERNLFFTPGKYSNNVFCYVGGLSVWQCFEETVDIYKKIEMGVPDCQLRIFTGEQEKARDILKVKGVKNYDVRYVKPNQLASELSSCKYGFIVREKSPVNYVATPTKLSNYMAAGLIPIVSNNVSFFGEILSDTDYSIVLNGADDIEKIINISRKAIDPEDVFNEYKGLFSKYYNTEAHISRIASLIKNIF